MRIRKEFAQRTRTRVNDEVVRKYFLVFEGDATEVQYFDGINSIRTELGINTLIDIRPILRSYNETGWTNPKKLLDRLIEYIDYQDTPVTLDIFAGRIIDYLLEDRGFSKSIYTPDAVYNIIINWFGRYLQLYPEDPLTDFGAAVKEVSRCLKKTLKIEKSIENLSGYLKQQDITYEEGFDKICLIVDRDRSSFVSYPHNDQYEYVKRKCEEKGFGFYLSNPCFEFWLLLHFDDVFKYDKDKLLENPKISKKLSYLESELRKFLPGYKKSYIRFDILKKRIKKAVENEKHFCEDIGKLKSNLGSNVGLLIEEMKS